MSLKLDIERTKEIIISFIKQRVYESGTKGVVIGLSGGIDSSVVGALSVAAVGKERVLGLYMPDGRTNPENDNHVKELVDILNCEFAIIPIKEIVEISITALDNTYGEELSRLAIGNLKARIRMNLWYLFANERNYLVAGGGNKSEIMTGYATKYGDSAVDMLPIGDLYKTQVRMLAKSLKIPLEITKKPPTAGLWDGQTDEDELGITYDLLDRILARIEYFQDDEEIQAATGASIDDINRVRAMIRKSEHKRQPPLIIKIGYRTPGIDWRNPYSLT